MPQPIKATHGISQLPHPTKRRAVIVLGMHRSGTSALSGVLRLLGVSAPKTLLPPNFANPSGYWESEPLVRAHDELLASLGSRWDDWRRLDPKWVHSDIAEQWRKRIRAIVVDEYGASPLLFIKDPRICRLGPFLLSVLSDIGLEIVVLLIFRNPLEVASSLQRRDGMVLSKACALWLRNMLDAEYVSRHLKRHFLCYEDLLTDWRMALEPAAADIGMRLFDESESSNTRVNEYLSHDLHHEQKSDEELYEAAGVPPYVVDTYKVLKTIQSHGETPKVQKRLDQIRRHFEHACEIFDPIFANVEKALNVEIAELQQELERARDRHRELEGTPVDSKCLADEPRSTFANIQPALTVNAERALFEMHQVADDHAARLRTLRRRWEELYERIGAATAQ